MRVLIIPPVEERSVIVRSKEQLLQQLSRQFPDYEFDLAPEAPIRIEGEFMAMPLFIEGETIPGDLVQALPMFVREEIEMACAEFKVSAVH